MDAAKTSPKHKPRLKRTGTWAAGASLAKIESEDTDLKQESQATELSSKGEESSLDHSHPTDSTTVQEEKLVFLKLLLFLLRYSAIWL